MKYYLSACGLLVAAGIFFTSGKVFCQTFRIAFAGPNAVLPDFYANADKVELAEDGGLNLDSFLQAVDEGSSTILLRGKTYLIGNPETFRMAIGHLRDYLEELWQRKCYKTIGYSVLNIHLVPLEGEKMHFSQSLVNYCPGQ